MALRVALDGALRKLAPKSPMTKAIRDGTKLWNAFTRFLDDGRPEIDNNIAERAIRPIAIGRSLYGLSLSVCKHWKGISVNTIIKMVEDGREGLENAQQMQAVVGALENAKTMFVTDHIEHHLKEAIGPLSKNARDDLARLSKLANYL